MLEQIKAYFAENLPEQGTVTDAERISALAWRITFDAGEHVSDWALHREDGEITSAYMFNEIY
jgi:hypothetical protein